jgi:hypothetical protein
MREGKKMAVFRVERTRDYTVMSNHHLKNRELSLKAKGLMSLMLSLPDGWDYTTKGLAAIAKDGVDSICSTVKELERTGYVTRKRIRDKAGRLGDIEYTIHEQPKIYGCQWQASVDKSVSADGILPKTEKSVLEEPKRDNPVLDKPKQAMPKQDEPKQGQPEQEKPAGNKYINKLNTQELNTNETIINQSIPREDGATGLNPAYAVSPTDETIPNGDGGSEASEVFRQIIKDNIEYEILSKRYGRERMEEIVELMLDTVCGERQYFTIGGSRFNAGQVKLRMLKIKACHIEYVFECLDKNTAKISNIKNYLLAALYNAPTTLDSYYGAEARRDLNGGFENG